MGIDPRIIWYNNYEPFESLKSRACTLHPVQLWCSQLKHLPNPFLMLNHLLFFYDTRTPLMAKSLFLEAIGLQIYYYPEKELSSRFLQSNVE